MLPHRPHPSPTAAAPAAADGAVPAGRRGPQDGHARGERGYRRTVLALGAAGVATFAQLYSVQAVLPAVAADLGAGPAQAAGAVSVATGALAVSVLGWSVLSDRLGRVRTIGASLVLASVLGLLVPAAPGLATLLVLRALQGAALGAVPAVAVLLVAEEVRAADVARAAAAYVAGTTVGGLLGRLVSSGVADLAGWRWGVLAVGVLGAAASAAFLLAVPPARGFRPGARRAGRVRAALADRRLLALYAQAALLMGAFVTVYNYLGFRLVAAPFSLPQAAVGLLFTGYLAGTASSGLAARLAGRAGRLPVLVGAALATAAGALLTAAGSLPVVLAGLLVLTAGFFAAHAVASGWTGARARATGRPQGPAMYSLAYYAGSSGIGWAGGSVLAAHGWGAVAACVAGLCTAAALVAVLLLRGPDPAG